MKSTSIALIAYKIRSVKIDKIIKSVEREDDRMGISRVCFFQLQDQKV